MDCKDDDDKEVRPIVMVVVTHLFFSHRFGVARYRNKRGVCFSTEETSSYLFSSTDLFLLLLGKCVYENVTTTTRRES